ncbi:MAG: putative zinc-binding protein [Desulfobacterales bacterium]|nr:putative zinc-binding protein [Desulfobacterales bacterium]
MNPVSDQKTIRMNTTRGVCPIGETTGKANINDAKIPVLSCEGACIRGEIARLAANMISREAEFGRACHGELITVPDSAIARWITSAEKVVLIDGCFLRCHGRIIENIIDGDRLVQFDALSHYNRYTDVFDYEDVPEAERIETARSVADWVLTNLRTPQSDAGIKSVPCSSCCGDSSGQAGG